MKKTRNKENIRQPVKVLHLMQGLEVGGLEYMVVSLLKGLNSTRYQRFICCYDTSGELAKSLNGDIGIHLLKRRQGIDYTYPFKLAALLKRESIQILHLHNSTALFYGVIAGKIARVPIVVYTEHARDVFPNIKVRISDKLLSLFTDKVIVVSDYLKKNLIEYEWFNPSKIMTIYNGVDETKFKIESNTGEIRDRLGLSAASKIIGIVARLDPIKNHKSAIKAIRLIVERFSNAVLLIVGDGPLRGELEHFVRQCKLEKHVVFLGTRTDVHQLLSIMDIFILCSTSEGMPVTLLEAMAAGRPIVATDVGGVSEVIEHGKNGLLIEPNSHELLADAILDLLTNKEKAQRMGLSARNKFESNFTLSAMIKKYEDVYASLLAHHFIH